MIRRLQSCSGRGSDGVRRRQRAALLTLLRADVAELRRAHYRVAPHIFPSLVAVCLFRVAVAARRVHPSVARAVAMVNHALTGADLDPQARIGPGLVLRHPAGVVVGPGAVAGAQLRMAGCTTIGSRQGAWPIIGDHVTLWTKASVIGPARVGDYAEVGAHALVLTDVPAHHIAIGVPATCRPASIVGPFPDATSERPR